MSQAFIDTMAEGAIESQKTHGILASVTIAQAILESGWGTSDLAKNANAVFGIKASNWNGPTYSKVTTEWDAKGNPYTVTDTFRKYSSWAESVWDHGEFLQKERYKAVIGETDYKKASQALQAAGYSTDPQYAAKLISLIERYQLNKYDAVLDPAPLATPSPTPSPNAKNFLVALDDGHGLSPTPTAGKRTPNIPGVGVIYENEFNRKVVQYLDEALRRCGVKTVLVAPGDQDWPLATRVQRANNAKADIFVSCHYNHSGQSHPGGKGASGLEIFHYPESKSKKLAQLIYNQVIQGTPQKSRGIKDGRDLYVIRKTTMPAILIEYGFMDDEYDNYREAKLMRSEAFQRESAEQTCLGICDYFGIKYIPPNTTVNPEKDPVYTYQVLIKDAKGNYVAQIQTSYLSKQVTAVSDLLKTGVSEILVKRVN